MSDFLKKLERWLVLSLPVVVFFSYWPVISLGSNETMNFELSLPLIWVALLGALSLRQIPKILRKHWRMALLVGSIPIYLSLSVLWSANQTRGVLTALIVWLLYIFGLNVCYTLGLKKAELKKLLRIYLTAAGAFALLCILQCILDVCGVGREITQLCQGCTYQSIGFPHPNGFAIEPQFMGNLLIAPCILAASVFYNKIKSKKRKGEWFGSCALLFLLIMSLYVVFSRGAVFACALAMIVLLVVWWLRDRNIRVLYLPLVAILAVASALLFQGVLAEISPTSEGFRDGIARSIHQMSLGKIDLRQPTEEASQNTSTFDGYIEESTQIRLSLNEVALAAWQEHAWFGAGIGGAGVAIHNEDNSYGAKEIVQNEYLSLLLELGIVGCAIIIIVAILVASRIFERKLICTAIIALAYLLSMGFFSGVTNVLHIYMLTPLIAVFEHKLNMLK